MIWGANESRCASTLQATLPSSPATRFCHNFRHPFADFCCGCTWRRGRYPNSGTSCGIGPSLPSKGAGRGWIALFRLENSESAGKEQLRQKKNLNHQAFQCGEMNEAERMYILGAMMMTLKKPAMPLTPDVASFRLLAGEEFSSKNTEGFQSRRKELCIFDPIGYRATVAPMAEMKF